jgi:hypothetical protein
MQNLNVLKVYVDPGYTAGSTYATSCVSYDRERGFSLSTQGMEDFQLREIEAKDVNQEGLEVFSLLLGTAQYLVKNGPVIKDGDTIGDSPALNIRVRQGPSYWREGVTVYRVTFPNN